MKEYFESNDDIVQLHITIALLCPLGQCFIETPVRGRNCKHVQCFDLDTYLLMNKSSGTWKCPVCNKLAELDSLVVDGYMEKILASVGEDGAESVKIAEDGTWEVFAIEFGDHSASESDEDDDDDGYGDNLKKRKNPYASDGTNPKKVMRVQPVAQPQVIDLTL